MVAVIRLLDQMATRFFCPRVAIANAAVISCSAWAPTAAIGHPRPVVQTLHGSSASIRNHGGGACIPNYGVAGDPCASSKNHSFLTKKWLVLPLANLKEM